MRNRTFWIMNIIHNEIDIIDLRLVNYHLFRKLNDKNYRHHLLEEYPELKEDVCFLNVDANSLKERSYISLSI